MPNFGQSETQNLEEVRVTPSTGDHPYWTGVSLYLPFNSGVSGDLSLSEHSVSYIGSASVSTSTYVSGDASLKLENSGHLEIGGPNYDFNFGTDDFTVEGWFKLPETGKRTALISDKGWGLAISPTGNSMVTPDTITVSKLGQVFRETFNGIDIITIQKNDSDVASFSQYVSVNGDESTPVFYPYIGDYSDYGLTGQVTGLGGAVNPSVQISVSEGDKITIKTSHHGRFDPPHSYFTWKKIFDTGLAIVDGNVTYYPSSGGSSFRTDGASASIMQDYIVKLDEYTVDAPNLQFSYYTGDHVSVHTGINPEINTWYHFAAERNGTNIHLYSGGQPIQTGTVSSLTTIGGHINTNLLVGAEPQSISDLTPAQHLAKANLTGYADEIRITKGLSRYNGPFTPTGYNTGVGNINKVLHVDLPSSGVLLRDKISEDRLAKAWVTFDGTRGVTQVEGYNTRIDEPPMMKDSYNVKYIEDLGTGIYKLNFINNLNNKNYIINGSCSLLGGKINIRTKNESYAEVTCSDINGNLADSSIIDIIIY